MRAGICGNHRPLDLAELRRQGWLHRGEMEIAWDGQIIQLVMTPAGFGGVRRWFACPGCNKGCRVLYQAATGLKCRRCHGLRYRSQYETGYERAIGRAQQVRLRLRGSAALSMPFPAKPKHMRWVRYWTLVRQDRELSERWCAGVAAKLGLFSGQPVTGLSVSDRGI